MRQEAAERSTEAPACSRCGCTEFFCNRIIDPANNRAFDLFRCKACDSHRWSQLPQDGRPQQH